MPPTKVVIVGRVNDVELYRELMRRGVSEYLVAPLNPLHLIEVISGLYLDPEAAPIGRVVTVVGCRGGVGSSTLAHNVGWCIAERFQINTAIVDLDLPFGTSGLDFNEEPGQGVAEALVGAGAPRRRAARAPSDQGGRSSFAVHGARHSRPRPMKANRRPMKRCSMRSAA